MGFLLEKKELCSRAQAADRNLPSAAGKDGPPEASDYVVVLEGQSQTLGGGQSSTGFAQP